MIVKSTHALLPIWLDRRHQHPQWFSFFPHLDRDVCDDSSVFYACGFNVNLNDFQCRCATDELLVECTDYGQTIVDLSFGNIKTVSSGAFKGFTTEVTDLYLNDNEIEFIQFEEDNMF